MTTILGIKTSEEAVVLAADTQINLYSGNEQVGKASFSKIRAGRNYAIAFTGNFDKYVESFFSYLAGSKDIEKFVKFVTEYKDAEKIEMTLRLLGYDRTLKKGIQDLIKKNAPVSQIEKALLALAKEDARPETEFDQMILGMITRAEETRPLEIGIQQKNFPELALVNRYLLRRKAKEDPETVELILATNEPSVELYHVNHFGDVLKPISEDFEYLCLGSGSEFAEKYISEEQYEQDPFVNEKIKLDNITISFAIKLAIGALKAAVKDVGTGGFIDLVVIKPKSIENHGKTISGAIEKAEREAYEKIISTYQHPPETEE